MNINYNKDKTDEIREIIKNRINETGISIKKLSKKSKVGYFILRLYILGKQDIRVGDAMAILDALNIRYKFY